MSAGRDQWNSRAGFVLAAIGAAVGLGNIWRFSYVAGENGGGAFLVVYVFCAVLIGAPIVVAELAMGRAGRGDARQARGGAERASRGPREGSVGRRRGGI